MRQTTHTRVLVAVYSFLFMKYEAKKGCRINHMFTGITTFNTGWWYNVDLKKWQLNEIGHGVHRISSHQRCRTLRAFRRNLKNMPKGVEWILVSRYKNCNVIAFS